MKTFRKYLKEDVDLIKYADVKNSIGFGITSNLQTVTQRGGQTRFGLIFGGWDSGADKHFDKVINGLDDSAAHKMTEKDIAAIKSLLERIVKEAEDKIIREVNRLGYK